MRISNFLLSYWGTEKAKSVFALLSLILTTFLTSQYSPDVDAAVTVKYILADRGDSGNASLGGRNNMTAPTPFPASSNQVSPSSGSQSASGVSSTSSGINYGGYVNMNNSSQNQTSLSEPAPQIQISPAGDSASSADVVGNDLIQQLIQSVTNVVASDQVVVKFPRPYSVSNFIAAYGGTPDVIMDEDAIAGQIESYYTSLARAENYSADYLGVEDAPSSALVLGSDWIVPAATDQAKVIYSTTGEPLEAKMINGSQPGDPLFNGVPSGFLSVQVHSDGTNFSVQTPNGVIDMTPAELADVIESSGAYTQGQPILLRACSSGMVCPAETSNAAEELANELGSPVVAPTNDVGANRPIMVGDPILVQVPSNSDQVSTLVSKFPMEGQYVTYTPALTPEELAAADPSILESQVASMDRNQLIDNVLSNIGDVTEGISAKLPSAGSVVGTGFLALAAYDVASNLYDGNYVGAAYTTANVGASTGLGLAGEALGVVAAGPALLPALLLAPGNLSDGVVPAPAWVGIYQNAISTANANGTLVDSTFQSTQRDAAQLQVQLAGQLQSGTLDLPTLQQEYNTSSSMYNSLRIAMNNLGLNPAPLGSTTSPAPVSQPQEPLPAVTVTANYSGNSDGVRQSETTTDVSGNITGIQVVSGTGADITAGQLGVNETSDDIANMVSDTNSGLDSQIASELSSIQVAASIANITASGEWGGEGQGIGDDAGDGWFGEGDSGAPIDVSSSASGGASGTSNSRPIPGGLSLASIMNAASAEIAAAANAVRPGGSSAEGGY